MHSFIKNRRTVLSVFFSALLPLLTSSSGYAQQVAPSVVSSAAKPETVEWVYRVRYGYHDEWWRIFRKYQIAILERQKQLGYVKEYQVWAPGLHTSEESRWDYRIVITRASHDAPPGQSESEVAKQLFSRPGRFSSRRESALGADHQPLGPSHPPGRYQCGPMNDRKLFPTMAFTRRSLLKGSGLVLTAEVLPASLFAAPASPQTDTIHLNLNENAYGASLQVRMAIERELSRISRYADADAARELTEQIAAHERVAPEQIVLGEILAALGLYLGSQGRPGGEFLYSTPGYLALIDAAAHVGGVGVPVPLNANYENDLAALSAKINSRTRALYLINPHNPTGTVSDNQAFKSFLRESSQHAPVIVDEAYLEYTSDFASRSAVSLVRDGANVLVFRTFDKIHGLAGLPIGYTLAPRPLADALHNQGLGHAESLGRLNIAAASAALADRNHVLQVRDTVAKERARWNTVLDELRVRHTASSASFVFFGTGRPQPEFAGDLRRRGVEIGRAFPPYDHWARITIGLPSENRLAQKHVREVLQASAG